MPKSFGWLWIVLTQIPGAEIASTQIPGAEEAVQERGAENIAEKEPSPGRPSHLICGEKRQDKRRTQIVDESIQDICFLTADLSLLMQVMGDFRAHRKAAEKAGENRKRSVLGAAEQEAEGPEEMGHYALQKMKADEKAA